MMNDFDKFREAAEEIKLDDLQRQNILDACKGKKRRRINYSALATVAAVLVVTVAVFSPGFLMRAGMSDKAANEAAVEDNFLADRDVNTLGSDNFYSQNSSNSENGDGKYTYTVDEYRHWVFNAEGFRSIYSTIPQSFINLVDYDGFIEWSSNADNDDGMAIVQFVEHFGISREDFDSANRVYANYIRGFYGVMPLYRTSYAENEIYEIFNTELIFSSGREAIDEYYTVFAETEFPKENGSGSAVGGSRPAEIIVPEEYYK